MPEPTANNRTHRKRHIAWEQAELASNGLYAQNLEVIARKFPALTPAELKICALIRAMLPSWQIAQKLGVAEVTIERHRANIRRKLKLGKQNLQRLLLAHLTTFLSS